jgi:hypothetical protein
MSGKAAPKKKQQHSANTKQRHFKGVTLHLLARIIVTLPAA